jgi:hypothetical protein
MFEKSIAAVRPFKRAMLVSFALGAIAIGGDALAANNTASASATAIVVTPISVSKTADLSFGKFSAGTGGTVAVDVAGTRTATGAVASSGTVTAAAFSITGEPGTAYTIDTVSGTSTNLTSGSDTMALALATGLTSGGSDNPTSGTLSAGGTATLHVGGTLTVGATQPTGTYAGTVAIAVAYQ